MVEIHRAVDAVAPADLVGDLGQHRIRFGQGLGPFAHGVQDADRRARLGPHVSLFPVVDECDACSAVMFLGLWQEA